MQKGMQTRECKLEVVRQIASGQKRPAQACREYGLAESVLSRWRKEYQERGEAAFQGQQTGETTTHGAANRRVGAVVWALGIGKSPVKKRCEHGIAERHAMNEQTHHEHPEAGD